LAAETGTVFGAWAPVSAIVDEDAALIFTSKIHDLLLQLIVGKALSFELHGACNRRNSLLRNLYGLIRDRLAQGFPRDDGIAILAKKL
jgi:hypothetical protein